MENLNLYYLAGISILSLLSLIGFVFRNIVTDTVRSAIKKRSSNSEMIQSIISESEKIIQECSPGLDFDPNNTHVSSKQLLKAFSKLNEAKNIDASDTSVILQDAYLRTYGKDKSGIKDLIESVMTRLRTPRHFLTAAHAAIFIENYDLALNIFKKATTKYPNDASVIFNYASLLATLKKYDEAIDKISKSILLDPYSEYRGRINKAIIYRELEEYDRALTELHIAKEINIEDYKARFEIAKTYYKQDKLTEALAFLEILTEDFPATPIIYSFLALIHSNENDKEKQIVSLESVLRLDPKNVNALVELGKFYIESGKNKEGYRFLEQAVHLSNGKYSLILDVAHFFTERRDRNETYKILVAGLNENSNSEERAEIENMIEEIQQIVISTQLEEFAPHLTDVPFREIKYDLSPLNLMDLTTDLEHKHIRKPLEKLLKKANADCPSEEGKKEKFIANTLFDLSFGFRSDVELIDKDEARGIFRALAHHPNQKQ